MTSTWHVDAAILAAYTDGRLDPAGTASVEAHLLACASCRAACAAAADHDELAAIWEHVAELVDTPTLPWSERVLGALGVSESTARLVAATPVLRGAWLLAVTIAAGFAVVAAYARDGDPTLFLWLAPLVPLAGVAGAYGPAVDPLYEIGTSTPAYGLRLLLLRTIAVTSAAALVLVPATIALPDLDLIDIAWLLPTIAVALGTLALASFVGPIRAGIVVGAIWFALVPISVLLAGPQGSRLAEQLFVFRPAAQLVCLIIAIAAAIVVSARRHAFDVVLPR
jgi:predicted anti-sigma-YlaC factor YlaD